MYINHNLLQYYPKYMHLRVFADNSELYNKYYEAIYNHNNKINRHPQDIDAGFDIFAPHDMICGRDSVNKLNYGIKCSAQIIEFDQNNGGIRTHNTGYYMHPRSSISSTPLRLANSTGIVDSGYRGNLIGVFDCAYGNQHHVTKYDRLIQICAPGLIPIFAELVDQPDYLGQDTIRGENGFGSTGC